MIRAALTPPTRRAVAKLVLDELRTNMARSRNRESDKQAIAAADSLDQQHALLQLVGVLGGDELELPMAELLGWATPYIPAGEKLLRLVEAELKLQALNEAARPVPPAGHIRRECSASARPLAAPHHPPAFNDHKRAAAGDLDD